MRSALVALGALLLASPGAGSRSPAAPLEIGLDPASITVGDPVRVSVRLTLPEPASASLARLVVPAPRWGKAEVLDEPVLVEEGRAGRSPRTWAFTITAFETGKIELPPLELRLGGDPPRVLRSAGGVELEVRSVLPPGEVDAAPAPPVPPRPLPIPIAFWWCAGALSAAGLLAGLALARRQPRAAGATVAPELPLIELGAALGGLDADGPEVGHARLSVALRRYLGRRCGFPALESTTTEVARRLVARQQIEPRLAARLRALLADCDGVKFARRGASTSDLEQRLSRALELAREVERALEPARAEPTE